MQTEQMGIANSACMPRCIDLPWLSSQTVFITRTSTRAAWATVSQVGLEGGGGHDGCQCLAWRAGTRHFMHLGHTCRSSRQCKRVPNAMDTVAPIVTVLGTTTLLLPCCASPQAGCSRPLRAWPRALAPLNGYAGHVWDDLWWDTRRAGVKEQSASGLCTPLGRHVWAR